MGNYEEIDDDDKVGPFILHNQYSILWVHCHRDGTSYHDHKPLFSPFIKCYLYIIFESILYVMCDYYSYCSPYLNEVIFLL